MASDDIPSTEPAPDQPAPASSKPQPKPAFLSRSPYLILTVVLFYLLLPHLPTLPSSLSLFPPSPNARWILNPNAHTSRPPEVRAYDFVVDEDERWPDGVKKRVFTINGEFPGPTIELRSGDTLRIRVTNLLSDGTSLHFHGLRHTALGSVSQDGAIGLTQCPIPPNGSYTYEIRTSDEQSGTFWYHSHHATQRADGLFGALIIHPPGPPAPAKSHQIDHHEPRVRSRTGAVLRGLPRDDTDVVERAEDGVEDLSYDEDLLLMVGDWFHRTGVQFFDWYSSHKSMGNEPVPDNALVNGEHVYECERSLRKITCEPERGRRPTYYLSPSKTYRLRFINPGAIGTTHISVDEHEMVVFEADGTSIVPVRVKELAVSPGQRYSVVLKYVGEGSKAGRFFWLRHRLDQDEFKYPNPALDLTPKSVISYASPPRTPLFSGSSPSQLLEPATSRWPLEDTDIISPISLSPISPSARVLPLATVDPVVIYVNTMKRNINRQRPFGYINQTSWRPNEVEPIMLADAPALREDGGLPGAEVWGKDEFVVTTSRNETVVVDIIINNLEDGPHPFHLHGHHFWPLYVSQTAKYGWGSYVWERPPTLLTVAPALRDTFLIPMRSHAVFRVKFDTPGMWMFHCHVLVHLKSGMSMAFDVMRDLVPSQELERVRESCAPFAAGEPAPNAP